MESDCGCEAGLYDSDGTVAVLCVSCPVNSNSLAGSDSVDDCMADAGFTGSGMSIVSCSSGTFKDASLSSAACTACSNICPGIMQGT